ncbi:MAG: hypothetical protein ACYCT1_11990 [Steroidobacteraceae bacterium]
MMEQTDRVSTQPAPDSDLLAQLMATAAALIERALLESLGPVEALGSALARLTAAAPAGALQTRADLTVCIQSLQFHDRLAQQLLEVRDLLGQTSRTAPSPTERSRAAALRECLRAHLTDGHDGMCSSVPRSADGGSLRMRADEGSVELF